MEHLKRAEAAWKAGGYDAVHTYALECSHRGDNRVRFVYDDPCLGIIEVRAHTRSDPVLVQFSRDYGRVHASGYHPCEWFDD